MEWLGDEATVRAARAPRAGFATEGLKRGTGRKKTAIVAKRQWRPQSGIDVALNE